MVLVLYALMRKDFIGIRMPVQQTMNIESDLVLKCIKCKHQKIDHDRTAAESIVPTALA